MAEPATRESSLQAPARRPQVFYVMGAGRSGSTILGVTLGNCANVFYAGELDAWLARSGDPQVEGDEQKRFWGTVVDDVEDAGELFGKEAERALERSLSLLRVHKWSARRRLRAPYRRIAEDLYAAIGRASGTELIVDTSHYPLRARELQAIAGIDLYLLYLVRDPRSVVASFNRKDVAQYRKSTLTTNVYLWLTNLLSVLVFLRQRRDRRLFVRYEDFVADPEGVVARILDCAGASTPPPQLSALKTGIPFQGNRLIRTAVIALEAGPAKPAQASRLTTLLQWPWTIVHARLRPSASAGAPRERLHAVAE